MEILMKSNLNFDEIFRNISVGTQADDALCKYRNIAYLNAFWAMVCMWARNGFEEESEELGKYMMAVFMGEKEF